MSETYESFLGPLILQKKCIENTLGHHLRDGVCLSLSKISEATECSQRALRFKQSIIKVF